MHSQLEAECLQHHRHCRCSFWDGGLVESNRLSQSKQDEANTVSLNLTHHPPWPEHVAMLPMTTTWEYPHVSLLVWPAPGSLMYSWVAIGWKFQELGEGKTLPVNCWSLQIKGFRAVSLEPSRVWERDITLLANTFSFFDKRCTCQHLHSLHQAALHIIAPLTHSSTWGLQVIKTSKENQTLFVVNHFAQTTDKRQTHSQSFPSPPITKRTIWFPYFHNHSTLLSLSFLLQNLPPPFHPLQQRLNLTIPLIQLNLHSLSINIRNLQLLPFHLFTRRWVWVQHSYEYIRYVRWDFGRCGCGWEGGYFALRG